MRYIKEIIQKPDISFVDDILNKVKSKIIDSNLDNNEIEEILNNEFQLYNIVFENGFDLLSHCTPDEFEKIYLYDKNGEYFGKIYGFACHAYVRVKP